MMESNYNKNSPKVESRLSRGCASSPAFKNSKNTGMSTLDALAIASMVRLNQNGSKGEIVKAKPVSLKQELLHPSTNPLGRCFSEIVVARELVPCATSVPLNPSKLTVLHTCADTNGCSRSGPLQGTPQLPKGAQACPDLLLKDREFMRGKLRAIYIKNANNFEELLDLCVAVEEEDIFQSAPSKLDYFKRGFRQERQIREVGARKNTLSGRRVVSLSDSDPVGSKRKEPMTEVKTEPNVDDDDGSKRAKT